MKLSVYENGGFLKAEFKPAQFENGVGTLPEQ